MADSMIQKRLSQLIKLLQEQMTLQEGLLELMQQKRVAMRDGRSDAMVAYCRMEQEKINQLAEAEKARLLIVGELTQMLDPDASAPLTMGELAEQLPEPVRGKLLVLRADLKQRAEAVRTETSIARRATASIVKHMHGLMQTIASAATMNPTYTSAGSADSARSQLGTLNMTA